MIYNIENIKKDFPILQRQVNGSPLVYLDNGATTQKPQIVLDALEKYYKEYNSNIHRGVHYLSQIATDEYEVSRNKVKTFLNAKHSHEIIFTSGTTGGINLLASSFSKGYLKAGDEILISGMEHHSNIVPWQMACEATGAVLKVVPVLEDGSLDWESFKTLLNEKTKIISITYVSNSLGTINPVEDIIKLAHQNNTPVILDAAQAVQHIPLDVQKLDVDFLVFSGHKAYGPTGVGILYGKENWLNQLPPYQGGGDMIKEVSFEKTTYNELPFKFEAGTPNIAGGIVLGVALDYLNSVGLENIQKHEEEILNYANERLLTFENIRIIGSTPHKASVISFLLGDVHPYDVGVLLDKQGIAVRTGHHCTQPLMDRFQIPGTVRASFAMYNDKQDVDKFIAALERASQMLL